LVQGKVLSGGNGAVGSMSSSSRWKPRQFTDSADEQMSGAE